MKLLTTWLEQKIPVFTLLISVLVAWFLFPLRYGFPMVAFSFFFITCGSLVYILRKNKTWFDTVLYIGILGLSLFSLFRANPVIDFLDFVFTVIFGSFLIIPFIAKQQLLDLFISPLLVAAKSLTGENSFPYKFGSVREYNRPEMIKKYIPTVLVTFAVLLITTPFLASANPFFNALLQNVLRALNLSWVFQNFFQEFIWYVLRIFVFSLLIYFIPRIFSIASQGTTRTMISEFFFIDYLVPKVAISVVLLIFFITQAQLYFASFETLWHMGYTNSRLTNEVFFQVTAVAFIVFFLAYLDKGRKKWNNFMAYVLIVEAFFLIGIAFKSVNDYVYLWGFTQKRLWGYASMTWLTGALVLFTLYYKKQAPTVNFFKQLTSYTIVVLLLINALNFDYLISHFSKAKLPSGTDYVYLARLSPDSHYTKETLNHLMQDVENSKKIDQTKTEAIYNVLHQIDNLKTKYSNRSSLNSFNFSEYQEYVAVKNINTEDYRNRIGEKQKELAPKPTPTTQPSTIKTY